MKSPDRNPFREFGGRFEPDLLDRAFPLDNDDWVLMAHYQDWFMEIFNAECEQFDGELFDDNVDRQIEFVRRQHYCGVVVLEDPDLMRARHFRCHDYDGCECNSPEFNVTRTDLFPRTLGGPDERGYVIGTFFQIHNTDYVAFSRQGTNLDMILERMEREDPSAVERMQ